MSEDAPFWLRAFEVWAQGESEQPPPFLPMFGVWTHALREQRDRDLSAIVTEVAQREAMEMDVPLELCLLRSGSVSRPVSGNTLTIQAWVRIQALVNGCPFLVAGYVSGFVIYDGHTRLTAAQLRRVTTVRCLVKL